MEKTSAEHVLTPLEFIRERLGWIAAINAEEIPLENIGIDSLELLDLQLACESQFDRLPSVEKYQAMRTIGDLANAFC